MKSSIKPLFMGMLLATVTVVCMSVTDSMGEQRNESDESALLYSGLNAGYLQEEAQQPAFPGAEGFGRYTKGGRGGDVYHVTNLNDSGLGSLRHGIETADGPLTIVFQVDGTIALNSKLVIDKPYITIAGQTAPQGWITLANYELDIRADHIIIRYLRVRVGDLGEPANRDGVSIGEASNIIMDHCSVSWSIDEALSSTKTDSLTIQWCIIAESLHNSFHSKGAHGYGGILSARSATYHHNLFAHHMRRMPNVSYRNYIQADYRNNVIYNWGNLSSYKGSSAHANWVNNYYKSGPATQDKYRSLIFQFEDVYHENTEDIDPLFYIDGNYVDGYSDITDDNWNGGDTDNTDDNRNGGIIYKHDLTEELVRVYEPFDYPLLSNEQTAEEAYEDVLDFAGASLQRDPIDARIVNDVRTGTAAKGRNGFIDSQDEVGGWPQIRSIDPPADSDQDGMPDWWENEHGLDPEDEDDRNLDRTDDGYTNLEEYLNWLADPGDLYPDQHPGNLEVEVIFLPDPINLVSPVKSSNDVPLQPEFTWESDEHAAKYQFQLFKGNMGFNDIKLDTILAGTEFLFPAELESGQYYNWRVRGLNDIDDEGNWSDVNFFTTEQTTSIGSDHSSRPMEFQLDQNFPNPFNPVTVIRYGLPESAHVDLRVYDIIGREVASLVQEEQQMGYYDVRFNSSSLTSGMYYYRIRATSADETGEEIFLQTRKMLLVK